MLGLDVRITDGFRLVLSYFFTVVNLVAVFEGKMVAICGVQLQLKQRELSEVLLLHSGGINGRGSSSGYVFGELPLFLVGTGVLAAVLSSYVSYVFYRCRIERWRSRKSIMPTLANNV